MKRKRSIDEIAAEIRTLKLKVKPAKCYKAHPMADEFRAELLREMGEPIEDIQERNPMRSPYWGKGDY